MKNRKKLLVLLMCTCMLLGTTACGNRRDTQNDTTMNDATDKTKDNNDKTDRNETVQMTTVTERQTTWWMMSQTV